METKQGLIVKSLGGFYYVDTGNEVIECRARGVFRNEKISPCVGDHVELEMTDGGKGYVKAIGERKNHLLRPPLSNLDQLVLISSAAHPAPNLLVLDQMIAICEKKNIEPAIIFTKSDLGDTTTLQELYEKAGFRSVSVCSNTGEGVEEVKALLSGKISAFTGNSGVGKSTLLNAIDPRLGLQTADISMKLGRGKHTTRHVELFKLPEGGWVADTPGFSAMDYQRFEVILKDELENCFREFEEHLGQCRFTGCSHTAEKGCAIRQALEDGAIARSRYESYCAMYQEAKNIKEWELPNMKTDSKR